MLKSVFCFIRLFLEQNQPDHPTPREGNDRNQPSDAVNEGQDNIPGHRHGHRRGRHWHSGENQ